MKRSASLERSLLLLTGLLLAGCSQNNTVAELRSLSASEKAVFLCRDDAGNGHPYADCPDRDTTDDTDPAKKLSVFALVSQTVTNEVAVVDVTDGHVIDVDPSIPGYGFLPVGGKPVSLATTPGGRATFVATADVGRNGLFALPTGCLTAPAEGRLELTSFPACRLDETPGELAVMVETSESSDGTCKPYDSTLDEYSRPESAGSCWADVVTEQASPGRRKLVVSFPDVGKLRVYDAQDLLDLSPGTFPRCQPERELDLQVDVPQGVAQSLPPDLETTCSEVPAPTAPPVAKRGPQPAGFALSDDNHLYIADQAAPVIHVLDTTSPCNLTELPSLLPMSLREPWRTVTTRRVAVSPLTPAGQRFVYAIDAEDQPGASVMAFDVSPGSTDVTPLVRSGSPELPAEKPDRLALGASAKDVAFAYRDIPYVDQTTGAAEFGVRCDPNPSAPQNEPATLARPNSDYTVGARPGLLRGLFGFILLSNGSIATVDVDDFDAACRRPIGANPSDTPDFRGCADDPITGYFTDGGKADGTPFVTNEVSCRVVEPHRFRSARLVLNNSTVGVRAPSLRGFPQLTTPASAANTASQDRARLLAVPFVGGDGSLVAGEAYVGSTLYNTSATGADLLPSDPNAQDTEQARSLDTLVLPPLEPRSYAADDTVTVTYEGSYAGDRYAGFVHPGDQTFSDDSLSFCAAGVYDVATMTDYASTELGLSDKNAARFGELHADYVQLTTALPAEDDSYWQKTDGLNRSQCLELFGPEDADTLLPARDFQIVSARADKLELRPRDAKAPVTLDDVRDCFPSAQSYRLRVGQQWAVVHTSRGFRHDVVESGPDRRCVRSCNPLHKWDKGRVFEIASDVACQPPGGDTSGAAEPSTGRVGCASSDDFGACVYDQTGGPVQPTDKAWSCVFDGLNERFALYRGRAPSVRDEVFTWQTTGGFAPLLMSLSSVSTVVSPQSIQYLRQSEQIAVVDGASQGLSLFSLDTFAVVTPSPFY